uniref:Integrase catalytic domain-containing protein n=1 Tax=Trichogramma kaykai TaxID=54128 RepID=A0ABD2WZR0_9HYME
MDIVTLVESEGYTHALTMIDRYARWPEAVPIADMQAETVARAFIETWVARYGAPETITTDQGMQFDGELFARLCKLLGSNKIRTTPYHPQSNGLLERWHRNFKSALMCFESDEGWTKILPLVMLGLRTRVRSDINSSPAEIVFGSTLRLPGEFFNDHDQEPDLHYFTSEFRSFMKTVRPVPVDPHDKSKPSVHKNLEFCSHVFVRANPIKEALDPPYLGPYKVHSRPSKYFYIIKITNKRGLEELKTVSTSRLKPAFGTFFDAHDPIKISPDINQNQSVEFDTRDSDLCDNFDHEEVVPVPKSSCNQSEPKSVKPKRLFKPSCSQAEPKSVKTKKKVKFHDDHAYSIASKSSTKNK